MTRQRYEPTWPLVAILVCLFVLSATSPSLWEKRASSRSQRLGTPPSTAARPLAAVRPAEPVAPAIPEPQAAPQVVQSPVPPADEVEPANFEMPELVEPAPPVANRPARLDWKPIDDLNELEAMLLPDPLVVEPSPEPVLETMQAAEEPQEPAEHPPVEEQTEQPGFVEVVQEPVQPQSNGLWKDPVALLEQLDLLAWDCETGALARDLQVAVRRLGRALDRGSPEAAACYERLLALRGEMEQLAQQLGNDPLAIGLRRTAFAIDRRLIVWSKAVASGGLTARAGGAASADPQRLALCLNQVDALVDRGPEGQAWAKYLALDALHGMAGGSANRDEEIARLVLRRLTTAPMTRRQRQFISAGPVASLAAELRRWNVEPVEFADLTANLEKYEQTLAVDDGRRVAEACQRLALASEPTGRELGRQLDAYYRNANVRVAVTGELLNRMIPERPVEYGCVQDVVMGNYVYGHSQTSTQVGVRLVPDDRNLRVALEIQGLVSALTQSTAGPATFHNQSQSAYRAWKEIEVGPQGMRIKPAEVAVSNDVRLRRLSTDFDIVPLIGTIVQEVARSQHNARREQMQAEVEEKVYVRAKSQVDGEADARLKDVAARLKGRIIEPLRDLALGPDVIDAETNAERVVLRVRLASDGQLGAHTPRPRAPSDSLMSLQIHESAMNNVVEQMQLDGRTFTLPELRQRIADRLQRPEFVGAPTEHDDLRIAFAKSSAVQVRCCEGRIGVTLNVARLTLGGQQWDDFQVRAYYRPEVHGINAVLVREDFIHLRGERLPTRSQIALRGVFGRVFSKDQPVPLIPPQITADRRMTGLVVSQFVLDDGWLGFALADRTPGRAVAARPRQMD